MEGVECVVAGALCRSDISDHHRLTVADERLAQNLRQFALTIRRVVRLLVNASYAFLQLHTRHLRALVFSTHYLRMSPQPGYQDRIKILEAKTKIVSLLSRSTQSINFNIQGRQRNKNGQNTLKCLKVVLHHVQC